MAPQPSSTRVAVLGPNGNLGKYVIPALAVKGFEITVITRDIDKTAQLKDSLIKSNGITPEATIVIRQGDYTSAESLAPSLQGHDSVVSLLNRDQTGAQIVVVDATVLAGVKHIVPAAFGVDSRIPEIRTLPHLAAGYIKSEDYLLKTLSEAEHETTFTLLHTGGFLEWLFEHNLFINLSEKGEEPSIIFDDGNTRLSASSMTDIGTAVATIVENRENPRFQNKYLLMHTITVSQNELMTIAKEILPDRPWPIVHVDTLEAERKSQEAFDASVASCVKAPASAYHGFFARAFFGKGLALFPHVDNDILGVKEQDAGWLKMVIQKYLVG